MGEAERAQASGAFTSDVVSTSRPTIRERMPPPIRPCQNATSMPAQAENAICDWRIDMRETASMNEMLEEILDRIAHGVRAVRGAAIVNGAVGSTYGLTPQEVEEWRGSAPALDYKSDICEPADRTA